MIFAMSALETTDLSLLEEMVPEQKMPIWKCKANNLIKIGAIIQKMIIQWSLVPMVILSSLNFRI